MFPLFLILFLLSCTCLKLFSIVLGCSSCSRLFFQVVYGVVCLFFAVHVVFGINRLCRLFQWFQVVQADHVVLVVYVVQIVDRRFTLFWDALLCVTLFWFSHRPSCFRLFLFFCLFTPSVAVGSSCRWFTHVP